MDLSVPECEVTEGKFIEVHGLDDGQSSDCRFSPDLSDVCPGEMALPTDSADAEAFDECEPLSCGAGAAPCGLQDDGCGGTMYCGCAAGFICEGGACVPDVCAPKWIGGLGGSALDVEASGQLAYVAMGRAGVYTFDISKAQSPILTSVLQTDFRVMEVSADAGLMVAGGVDDSATIPQLKALVLDLAQPSAPIEVSEFYPGTYPATELHALETSGGLAFAVTNYSFEVFDITKAPPTVLSSPEDWLLKGESLALYGDILYVTQGNLLNVVDVSAPEEPTTVGTSDVGADTKGMTVDAGFAYLAQGTAGVAVVDLSAPELPLLLATLEIAGGDASRVTVSSGYALVAAGAAMVGCGPAGLISVDIENPASPVVAASFLVPGDAQRVFARKDRAYSVGPTTGLSVLDIATPTVPVVLGRLVSGAKR